MTDLEAPRETVRERETALEAARAREAEENAPLLELASLVPDELKARLAEIHDGLYCAARNEGLNCCVDFLIGTWGP